MFPLTRGRRVLPPLTRAHTHTKPPKLQSTANRSLIYILCVCVCCFWRFSLVLSLSLLFPFHSIPLLSFQRCIAYARRENSSTLLLAKHRAWEKYKLADRAHVKQEEKEEKNTTVLYMHSCPSLTSHGKLVASSVTRERVSASDMTSECFLFLILSC